MNIGPPGRSGGRLLRRVRPRLHRVVSVAVAVIALPFLATPARAVTTLAAGGGAQTIVSLTFDDGTASQYWALGELSSHGMLGTFYVNSSRLGTSNYYMTWSQVHDLYAAGNEIGGHTAYHVNLPNTDPGEAQRQVCDDRVNLLNAGFQVTDFAYPFGAYNSAIEQMVQQCGYNSARSVNQQTTETMPPADPYAIHIGSGSGNLTALENAVTAAEQSGGGWVPIMFHQICNACDTQWITQSDFDSFLNWLQSQQANGVAIERVKDVIGGSVQPSVYVPPPAAPNGWNVVRNASLEYNNAAASNGAPDCYEFDQFGTNNATFTYTNDAHTGSWAERLDITSYTDGDAKLTINGDLGRCTPTVTPGHRYVTSVWYKSSAPVHFIAFTRNTIGSFSFWDNSGWFPATSTWQQASWTTAAVPDGVTGLRYGLAIASSGFVTVDDFGLQDAAPTGNPDTTPPTVSMTSPTDGSTVAGSVPITVSASDNVAVDHVDYLIDGAVAATVTNGLNTYNWYSRNVANGPHTIAVRAVDPSGNSTTTSTRTVYVSNSQTNLLQNPSLETASGSTPTCWLLGGYGTNTYTWARTTDAHTGSYAENLAISSWSSGDRKLVNTQDSGTCAPAVTPGHTYVVSAWYKMPAGTTGTPRFFAYYRSGGSWIYWTQSPTFTSSGSWTQANWTTPPVPSGATNLSVGMGLQNTGSVTMDDFGLYDNGLPPDTTPPTSTISCNGLSDGGGCAPGWYGGPVQVTLSATDNLGGSGVGSIRYTTDGSDPSTTNGQTYSGAFTVTSTATVKYRAYDNAGNAEAIHSQPIQIDTTPPGSTISCNSTACGGGWQNTPVSVALTASDTGGSGVAFIRYTTDGSDPTLSNGSDYIGPFSLTSTTTVKYRAYDNAGNAEPVNSQLIRIDTTPPTSMISCNGSPCSPSAYAGSASVSLSATDNSGGAGIAAIYYTTDGTDPTATAADLYGGTFPLESTATVKYRALDNAGNLEPVNSQTINVAPPNVTLTSPSNGSVISGTTNLSATVSGINVSRVEFFVDGTVVATLTASPYTTTWDSTTVPDGTHTVIAAAFDVSGAETDSAPSTVSVSNNGSDTTPPTSSIACNGGPCGSGWYNSGVSVSLSATDNQGGSGVASIRYTTDGSDPSLTNGLVYGGAFSVGATTTVKYRAYDNAGNAEPINTQLIQIDTVAPNSAASCNGATCSGSFYTSSVSVGLAASDNNGGSGVAAIRYTTDGSDPTMSNGATFSAPFSVTATTTVKYRAYDNAGNAEPINTALIQVDTSPPTTTIQCNGGSCSGWFKPGASVSLSATDNTGGSGVASIRYTTDGSDPTPSTGTLYTAPFIVNATTTVKYRAYDNVGNAESIRTQVVQIDSTAPTVSLTSPGGGTLASGTVTLSANASDNVGVDHVDFLVDGTVVGSANSPPYTFAWNSKSVTDGTHAITARAYDLAGNATTSSSVSVTVTNNNLLQNPSLESASGSTPTCWLLGGYGTNSYTWTRTTDAHSGGFAESLTISSWTSGDRKLVNTQDSGTCAPAVTPGHSYTVTVWYKMPAGTTGIPRFFAYYRSGGSWVYWTQSPTFTSSGSWTQVSWTTPAVPSGATNLSVGMGLQNTGSVTMDDFGLFATG